MQKKSRSGGAVRNGAPPRAKSRRTERKRSVKRDEERAAKGRALPLPLTRNQLRYLRGLGHALSPVIWIGHKGLTEAVVNETNAALVAHELVKVKLQKSAADDRDPIVSALVTQTQSELVDRIGQVALVYRPPVDAAKRKIVLPRL